LIQRSWLLLSAKIVNSLHAAIVRAFHGNPTLLHVAGMSAPAVAEADETKAAETAPRRTLAAVE
jgi:hypothetical protein